MHPPESSDRHREAAPAVHVVNEFRRRRDLAIGPDRPAAVVEVEVGDDVGKVDIGGPIGVDGPDVAPIGLGLLGRRHARLREVMGDRLPVLDEVGDDVLAEIVARIRIRGVALEQVDQERSLEHIDAHAAERDVGLAGHRRGILRLFEEEMMLFLASTCMTPKPLASSSEASRQPTVTSAPESTCCCSIFS